VRRTAGITTVALLVVLAVWIAIGERPAGDTGRWLRELGLSPRVANVNGVGVRYVRSGQGPPLVLVHGLAASVYSWSEVLAELAKRHDVVAVDLPGFGGSEMPPDLTFAAYPPTVLGLMDQLGLARASLVGNSMGGAAAAAIAADHPDRVERLVLIDSAGLNLAPKDRPAVLRLVGALPGAVLERLPVRRALTRLALPQVFFDPRLVTEERFEEYLAPLLRRGAVVSLSSLLSTPHADAAQFQALLRRIRAPTLILWGREDRWIPVAQADRFAAAIPNARLTILAGCGHLPQEERPLETAALVASFLASPP